MAKAKVRELVASCPHCRTFETLLFRGEELVPTKRFMQRGDLIYHDCGSTKLAACSHAFPGNGETLTRLPLAVKSHVNSFD